MTLMLASVTGPDEAEIAIAGGADIIDLKDPARGAFGAVPVRRIRETVASIAGRRQTSAVTGDLPSDPDRVLHAAAAIAETGVDFVKAGLFPGDRRPDVIRALAAVAGKTRLVGVLFADRETDFTASLDRLAEAGFHGAMLDTAQKSGGRLLTHIGVVELQRFVREAKDRGLMVGLAGGLEEPDVPRLLQLSPDLLGFRGALCAGGRSGPIDAARVAAIRRLIPRHDAPALEDGGNGTTATRSLGNAGVTAERIFVRDFVLPVRIGAYSHEKGEAQKVRFDVIAELAPRLSAARDMGDVLSYDLIIDGIRKLVAEGHVDLVETLAERIGALVLEASPRALGVTVCVEKLELGPGGAGVELVMQRKTESMA